MGSSKTTPPRRSSIFGGTAAGGTAWAGECIGVGDGAGVGGGTGVGGGVAGDDESLGACGDGLLARRPASFRRRLRRPFFSRPASVR